MAFTQTVDDLLVKAHLSQVPRPIVAGALLVCIAAAFVSFVQLWTLFSPHVLDVDTDAHISYATEDAHGAGSSSHDSAGTQVSSHRDTASGSDGGGADGDAGVADGSAVKEKSYVYVHVAGAVTSPGVYAVIEQSRVQDAVDKAGGLTEGAAADAVNLARVIQDGEQIYIPTETELQDGVPLGEDQSNPETQDAEGVASKDKPVNINTASASELESLPGVGPSTAQKIIADREASGPFTSIEDLMRVSGIGEKKFAELQAFICV